MFVLLAISLFCSNNLGEGGGAKSKWPNDLKNLPSNQNYHLLTAPYLFPILTGLDWTEVVDQKIRVNCD